MTCDECFESFSACLDGELPSGEHAALDRHLDECWDCRRLKSRVLCLSAEIKGQDFPELSPAESRTLAATALAGAEVSAWLFLRRYLRLPYENWLCQHGLRLAAFGGISALVCLTLAFRWLLPLYDGMEAVSQSGVPETAAWTSWTPSPWLLSWAPSLVLLVAAWTSGLPALVHDLWVRTPVSRARIIATAVAMAWAGPFAALPLLVELRLTSFAAACCAWTGLWLVAAFVLIAGKTSRPLPRLALDFAVLMLPLGMLEAAARASLNLPRVTENPTLFTDLAGSLPFPILNSVLALLVLTAALLGSGLAGMIPSHRGERESWPTLMLVLAGLGCLAQAAGTLGSYAVGAGSPKARLGLQRHAYVLTADSQNPWMLSAVGYPQLNALSRDSDADSSRIRLAAAYLDWDEAATLEALKAWAQQAPGVAWGISAFVDGLGRRQGQLLTVPTVERQQTVYFLLRHLRWRVLSECATSATGSDGTTGTVRGRIQDATGRRQGLRLRLMPVRTEAAEAVTRLSTEASWAEGLRDNPRLEFGALDQRTAVSDADGGFELSGVPHGRYVLALLTEGSPDLTYNSSIPGVIEVQGASLRLPDIKLSTGEQGDELDMDASRWRTYGPAELVVSRAGRSALVQPGGEITSLLDDHSFEQGSARIRVLTDADPSARGEVRLKLLGRDGRLLAASEQEIRGGGHHELEIGCRGRQAYLQVAISATTGDLRIKAARLEVRP